MERPLFRQVAIRRVLAVFLPFLDSILADFSREKGDLQRNLAH